MDGEVSFLEEKLKLFLEEAEAKENLDKAIASAGLVRKDYYSKEEINKILEAMISQGGFVEFVARSAMASLMLGK